MFKFDACLDPAHLKWAKRNMLTEDSKFKMLLSSNHWLIEEATDPELMKKELIKLLAIRAQTSTWTLNLRSKQEQFKGPQGAVPIELITDADYYILARNFDDTYRFSDDRNAYDNGSVQEKYLDAIVKARPHLKDTWGSKPHDVGALATYADLMACLHLYQPKLDLNKSSTLAAAMDLTNKFDFIEWCRVESTLEKWIETTKNWTSNNPTGQILLYTQHVPRGKYGVTTPNDWLDTLKHIGDSLDNIFENPDNRRMIQRMKNAGFYNQDALTMVVDSTSKGERMVTLNYYNIVFYHKFKFYVNEG